MAGKATAREIEEAWTYRDMLMCTLFIIMEHIVTEEQYQVIKNGR